MAYEAWRMSRTEVRDLLNQYEKAVEQDAIGLLRPTATERRILGDDLIARRVERLRVARDANRRFIEALLEDLPDLCAGPLGLAAPPRPLAEFRDLGEGTPTLPSSQYGSIAKVMSHLLRDWSAECDHVFASTYAPALAELRAQLPGGGDVLVPGAGLARLAVAIAAEGYRVEANEGSRLFLTVADYVLNRAQVSKIYPNAHYFAENFDLATQYLEVAVPTPSAGEAAAAGSTAAARTGPQAPALTMVPGDFAKTYGKGGRGHRRFDAIVSCFFLDTADDAAKLVEVMDGLLEEGGVLVNIGPLNWSSSARLKLNWEEMTALWRGFGYEFLANRRVECDYSMRRGLKMYTESYNCALSVAKKRPASTT